MTAEVGVLNKLGVALAADSASTIGPKVSNTANKIFALCRNEPVGVMTYGLAEFMGVPWETLIKLFRKELGRSSKDYIKDYAETFLQFLGKQEDVNCDDAERSHTQILIRSFLRTVSRAAASAFSRQPIGSEISLSAMRDHAEKSIGQVIEQCKEWLEKQGNASSISIDSGKKIAGQNNDFIRANSDDLFRRAFPFGVDMSRHYDALVELAGVRLAKMYPMSPDSMLSGVVIAGFGDRQAFPAIQELQLEGFIDGKLKYCSDRSLEIKPTRKSLICPFAQARDALETSLSGIATEYREFIISYVVSIYQQIPDSTAEQVKEAVPELTPEQLDQIKVKLSAVYGKELIEKFAKELTEEEQGGYRDPVLQVVAILSVSELAALAEALVNLAALRKKLSPQMETVGGPTDVAVITKGDGFIWVKRKHYFDANMNPQFMSRYSNGEYAGQQGALEIAERRAGDGQGQTEIDRETTNDLP